MNTSKLLAGTRCWAKKNREYLSIITALLFLYLLPGFLRGIDPSAAPIDTGVLSAIALAVVAVLIFKSVTWFLIKSIWPVFAEFSTDHFARNYKNLTACQKIVIYLSFYSLLFFSFVIALVAFLP